MRIGNLLIEAKLTEGDFQKAPKEIVRAYRDFNKVFDDEDLPQSANVSIVSAHTERPGLMLPIARSAGISPDRPDSTARNNRSRVE